MAVAAAGATAPDGQARNVRAGDVSHRVASAAVLTITRRVGEKILIGTGVEVMVREVRGSQVRIGIVAPAGLPVVREELFRMIADQNAAAARTPSLEELGRIEARLRALPRTGTRRVYTPPRR